MYTFAINQYGVFIKHSDGTSAVVRKDSPYYLSTKNACLTADWSAMEEYVSLNEDLLAVPEDDSPEFEAEDEFVHAEPSIADKVNEIKGLIADGLVDAEDLDLLDPSDLPVSHNPHDLSQWNGSPIFYPTMEQAMAQHERWSMFWDFHDFGPEAPNGYRYATVPRGIGPYAPEGYDWVCLRREDRYK